MKTLTFGSKAETLRDIRDHYPEMGVPALCFFSARNWRENPGRVLSTIEKLPGNLLAVRSSALSEDTAAASNAGAFLSLLDVDKNNLPALTAAIERVLASMPGEDGDQVLVQAQAQNIDVFGVIFTRCLDDGAPYYVINYDDESGATDRVTGGIGVSKTVHIFRNLDLADIRSPRIRLMVETAKQLEGIFQSNALDIELGLAHDGRRHIFQVRPLSNVARWPAQADQLVTRNFEFVESFFHAQCAPKPGSFGRKAVFGVMPDWNPAEMIGVLPRPLATSLYREFITRDTWRKARENMGYRPVDGELMVVMAGRPYIDVRQSFNSFLPPNLPDKVYEKIINAWLERLQNHPELHDKVEFAVAATCLDFNFRETWRERYPYLLSPEEEAAFEDGLRLITLAALLPGGSLEAAEADIAMLEARQQSRLIEAVSCHQHLAWINHLRYETNRYGTPAFSILARHGFIAESLLRSAAARGALDKDRVEKLKVSAKTVASRLANELNDVLRGQCHKDNFIKKYGHLRPSTYDILSPRYADRAELFELRALDAKPQDAEGFDFSFTGSEEKALTALLKEAGLDSVTPVRLLEYLRRAIAGREYAKFVFTRNVSDVLELIAGLGQSIDISREDMSFMDVQWLLEQNYSGLLEPMPVSFREHIDANKRRFDLGRALRLPYLLTSPGDVRIVPQHRSAPNFVAFRPVIAPVACLSSQTFSADIAGHIICTENADPGFDWIFSQPIAGLVTKFGGANSHMAVRCSEYSLPAAIGCGEKLYESISRAERVELDPVNKIVRPVHNVHN
jgi:phosphoenolpyruvate synthase/pyruvate phosphate dikinase